MKLLYGIVPLLLCVIGATGAQQIAASRNVTSASATATSVSPSTLILTIATTLASGQSLPASVTATATRDGSVYYLPTTTVASNTASPTTLVNNVNATTTASAASTPLSPALKTPTTLPLHTVIDPAFGVLGGVLILAGLPMTFYGHRNRWSSYFLSGFFAAALVCISIILKVGVLPAVNPPAKGIRGLFLVSSMIAGTIGGILSILFWRGAGVFASGLGAFFFGLFLQATAPGGLISPVGMRYVFYIGLFAVFFSISCIERLHTVTLAVATAITGATALVLGIDCFSTQGLKEFYVRNVGFDALFSSKYPPMFEDGHFPLMQGMQVELGVLGALIIMGVAFQLRLWSDLRHQLSVLSQSDHRRNMRSRAERAARAVARNAKRDLAAWEARHGYSKTASGTTALHDEENPSKWDEERQQSRSGSIMTRFRSNSEATQLATSAPWEEKRFQMAPSAHDLSTDHDFRFPTAPAGRRSASFIDYLKTGPEYGRSQSASPFLDLKFQDEPMQLGVSDDTDITTAKREPAKVADHKFHRFGTALRTPNGQPLEHSRSLDLGRAIATTKEPVSFRTRSASTAALMENAATFLSLPDDQKQGEVAAPVSKKKTSFDLPTVGQWSLDLGSSHPQTKSLDLDLPAARKKHVLTTKNADPMEQGRAQSTPLLDADRFGVRELELRPSFHGQSRVSSGPVCQDTTRGSRISVDGLNPNVSTARQSLAMRREEQVAVPWTNPGHAAGTYAKLDDSAASPRVRRMSVEELGARHRAKLAALQKPATETVQEADALQRAKDAWERKQALERRRMREREERKLAATAEAERAGRALREERRKSSPLNASLLGAVDEGCQALTGIDRAAEWSKSVSATKQLDPIGALPPVPASIPTTRADSSDQDGGEGQTQPNPFVTQPSFTTKELTETDRRRLSQGAGGRPARSNSRPLLDFNLP